ncbi:uncharacterized protein TRIADDRAFT_26664 [Trichoplax adhaerens]|uniref:N-alpha-acetyltransferase 40 n=1 Tax=Trichoplax adhaerens TaxID=10228 RepID=B3S0D4_TRIAD|nr:hypothetical protein TRIADDRAFT_26664 [Trichoplax adhaerens]EDV23996.1 hypothetical protein TRIADDRAFT_26664 [Trichoplax adhaerens]|eukprot:XP_002113522.1 hypothetical protein TRIADDRAFT_26664 [Trichoplax adhaerens]
MEIVDQLNAFPEVKSFLNNGFQASIECKKVPVIDSHDLEWAFNLTKQNMQSMYITSEWGWDDKEKKEEMFDKKGWYLIARNDQNIPIGMVSFRFDIEEGDAVVYCYEIQLSQSIRGKGLGKYLMNILKLLGTRSKMDKVMLTVFKRKYSIMLNLAL